MLIRRRCVMSKIKAISAKILKDESAQGMVEYGLVIALIAVVVIGIVTTIGLQMKNKFTQTSKALK